MVIRLSAVISDKKTPGAIELTRILVSTKVIAGIRVKWMKAALLEAYANWRPLIPFMTPEILVMLMMLGDTPLLLSIDFERSGRKAAATKYWQSRSSPQFPPRMRDQTSTDGLKWPGQTEKVKLKS
jgi:hypothetical protein